MVPEKTVRAVRAKAELLNGGASLGESGDLLVEMAVQKALAWCQRRDVPEDMEQAAAALALALCRALPGGGASGGAGEGSGDASGGTGPDWEALLASGAVKSVQRGDTAISFNTGAEAGGAASSALGGSVSRPAVEAALADLAPWRRLGRPRRPEREGESLEA